MNMNDALSDVREYLEQVRIPIRLASMTPGGWPMLISLWYLYQDGLLYCATQESARITRYIENDNRVAFEVAADDPPYCGVRGQAKARVDDQLGAEILEKLLVRYLGGTKNELAQKLLAKKDSEVAIVLDPKRIYTWDFRERMKNIGFEQPSSKVCP
jgi:nitroimidazol reductase NimA-like FMN-containing flavoprotein (pyridoxamine 5'-phosphate oxidase superfamily)